MSTTGTMTSGWKTLKLRLTGVSPLILHNGQLADPLNKFSKKIKEISGKRKKVDADHARMAELEFKGGLYVDENSHVILPPEGIEATIVAGAKKSKEGQVAKAEVYCKKPAILLYEGPQDPEELWKDENFRLTVGVKVNGSRIMRTRPIFKKWAAIVELAFNGVNAETVINWLKTAGAICGSFDWRPRYGRFQVEEVEE